MVHHGDHPSLLVQDWYRQQIVNCTTTRPVSALTCHRYGSNVLGLEYGTVSSAHRLLQEKDAKAIEPRVKTCERALFSPATSTVDPSLVMQAMKKDALDEGVPESGEVRRYRHGPGCAA